jgi:hypothetical protein
MRKLRINRMDSRNGEIHFILDEFQPSEYSEHPKDFDLAEIKRISRKEAAKPLALVREE